MFIGIKVQERKGKLSYIVTEGRDRQEEIAAFDEFLKAALVIRYISGGNMRPEDARNALAAISEFDEAQEETRAERAALYGEKNI